MPAPPIPPRPSDPPPIPPRPPPSSNEPCNPPQFPPILKGPLISDGSCAQSGVLRKGIKWQASGILEQGVNLPGQSVDIKDALTIHMGSKYTCCDEKGRQRTEILSWPPSEPSQTHLYKWRYHLSPSLPTSYKFFHLTQLFSREQGGFLLSLGLVKPNRIKLSTIEFEEGEGGKRGCEGNKMECEAERYWGKTVQHRMLVRWGTNGMIDYTVCDVATSEVLIKFYVENVSVPAKGSIKCGLYRQHVCSSASAVVGDFDFTLRK
ncbi:hypothetical protein JCM5353_004983 [Sporobolomyces roseus]